MTRGPEGLPRRPSVGRRDFIRLGAAAGAVMSMPYRQTASAQGGSSAGCIDCHAHWHPRAYVDFLAQMGMQLRHDGVRTQSPLNVDLEERIKDMDARGVQMHVLTLLNPPWEWAPPEIAARIAQVVNDAAIEAHTKYPDRFIAGVAMPVRNPALALKELNRVAGKPGIRGIHLPTSLDADDYLFEPAFEPIFARAQELGYPLVFHPVGEVMGAERLQEGGLSNPIGFTLESSTTASKFIVLGVLDKFPTLDIVLPHSGGAFPYLAGRLEHSLARRNAKLARPFKEYVRRFHFDTITDYPETLRFLISLVGADRVVIGTDNFAQMDLDGRPTALVESLNLPAPDLDLIVRGNAKRIFRL